MVDRTKRTEPSPMAQFTPPEWKLNGSSFGPQLLFAPAAFRRAADRGRVVVDAGRCGSPVRSLGPGQTVRWSRSPGRPRRTCGGRPSSRRSTGPGLRRSATGEIDRLANWAGGSGGRGRHPRCTGSCCWFRPAPRRSCGRSPHVSMPCSALLAGEPRRTAGFRPGYPHRASSRPRCPSWR